MASIGLGCMVPHPPIMVPSVGGRETKKVDATVSAMKQVSARLAEYSPDTVVIISPHGPLMSQKMGVVGAPAVRGDLTMFGSPSAMVAGDTDAEFVDRLVRACADLSVPIARVGTADRRVYPLDHGVVVPMSYLRSAVPNAKLVITFFSMLPYEAHIRFGEAVARAAEGSQRVAFVASGDLSHRLLPGAPAGFDARGAVLDKAMVGAFREWDLPSLLALDPDTIEAGGECGLRSLLVLFGAIGSGAHSAVLSYEGPFGVGYMVGIVEPEGATEDPSRHRSVLSQESAVDEGEALRVLARRAVETYVREGKRIVPSQVTGVLAERAGVFVCLKKSGVLRGCIGTFEPTRPSVSEEIVDNAISSASRDPRFPPVEPSELRDIAYTVDVLTRPERIESAAELDPRRYGVIVTCGGRRGLLLPDLEGVDTAEQQISISRQKAGIRAEEPVQLWRFEVRRY